MNVTETSARPHCPPPVVHMMGDSILPDERIMRALDSSRLVEDLREFEIAVLASLITVRYFSAQEIVVGVDNDLLKDSLMILVEGEVEVSAMVNHEPVSLHLKTPGDLARVISFVGGKMLSVSARINIKKDSAALLLQRSKLETLLYSHPAIAYCVMRNLVRHIHGVARRKSAEKEEMSNYLYCMHGLY